DLGVAGINIEDSLKQGTGLADIREHAKLLQMVRTALDSRGFADFYVNARIDTYFQREAPFAEADRDSALLYEAGAR
ncbi:isocitrate lyase/phosphoenolpyruvate mutase family protein, partial [Rhizobium ruizarguesonis]